jgi:O-antigen/teichoic acid export membrane protein
VQINLLIAIIQLLSYYIVFKRLIVAYRLKCEVDTSIIKKFLSFSGYLYLSKITRIIRTQGVRFLISYFINPAAVTLYIVPNKLIVAASGLLSSAVGALFPYTSSLSAGHKIKLITETFYKTMVVFLLVGTPMFVFLIFNAKYILTLWIGLEFAEQTEWVLVFLALTALIGSLTMVPINMLLGIGRTDIILYFAVFNFTLYVILLPYLTAYYGIMGLVVGMFLATLLNLGLVISKSFDALGITFKDSLDLMLRKCIPLLLFCMLMAIVKYLFLTKTLVLFASSVANLIIYYFFVSKFILEINFAKVKEVK